MRVILYENTHRLFFIQIFFRYHERSSFLGSNLRYWPAGGYFRIKDIQASLGSNKLILEVENSGVIERKWIQFYSTHKILNIHLHLRNLWQSSSSAWREESGQSMSKHPAEPSHPEAHPLVLTTCFSRSSVR